MNMRHLPAMRSKRRQHKSSSLRAAARGIRGPHRVPRNSSHMATCLIYGLPFSLRLHSIGSLPPDLATPLAAAPQGNRMI